MEGQKQEEGGGMGKPDTVSWGVPSQELWAMAPPSGPLRNHFCTELAEPGSLGGIWRQSMPRCGVGRWSGWGRVRSSFLAGVD